MPYEYRRMTSEQRQAVVDRREKLGYPLHSPPHPYRYEGCYFITGANFEHASTMNSSERRDELASRLLSALKGIHAEVFGWVVVPNHYHAMIGVRNLDIMSLALKGLHGSTAREWNPADGETG